MGDICSQLTSCKVKQSQHLFLSIIYLTLAYNSIIIKVIFGGKL